MATNKDLKAFSIRLPVKSADQIEHYAKKMGLSSNQLINNIVEIGLDDLRLLNSVGLLVVGRGVRDLVEKIRHGEIKMNGQGELQI